MNRLKQQLIRHVLNSRQKYQGMQAGGSSGWFPLRPLGDIEYPEWAFRMKMLLIQKDLWHEDGPYADGPLGAKALAAMVPYLDSSHLYVVMSKNYGREAWEALKGKHQSLQRRLQLDSELDSLRMRPGESVGAYFCRARALFWALSYADTCTEEQDVVVKLLKGLPPTYDTMRFNVLFSARSSEQPERLTFDKVETFALLQELKLTEPDQERQQQDRAVPSRPLMLEDGSGQGGWRTRSGRGRGGGGGVGSGTARSISGGRLMAGTDGHLKAGAVCWTCNREGHVQGKCPGILVEWE